MIAAGGAVVEITYFIRLSPYRVLFHEMGFMFRFESGHVDEMVGRILLSLNHHRTEPEETYPGRMVEDRQPSGNPGEWSAQKVTEQSGGRRDSCQPVRSVTAAHPRCEHNGKDIQNKKRNSLRSEDIEDEN